MILKMFRRLSRLLSMYLGGMALRSAESAALLLRDESLILRSGVFDVAWYEAQSGERFLSRRSAIRHYLRSPRKLAYSPNPFFEAETFDPNWQTRRANPLVAYLSNPEAHSISPHPYLDLERLRRRLPTRLQRPGAREPFGPWSTWVRTANPSSIVPTVAGLPPVTFAEARSTLMRAALEWRKRAELASPLKQEPHFTPTVTRSNSPLPSSSSTDRPRVSVVMATWNRAPSLRVAIGSIQAQTFGDFEVIVVDDGSDDDTAAVMAGIAEFDSRVRYLRQARGGVCRARNAGLEVARGDYIAFLDSDNTWRPEFLAAMVSAMDRESWRVAHGAIEVRNGARRTYRASEGSRESLLLGNYIDLNVLLARRDLLVSIGGFDESLRRAVDYDLILRLTLEDGPHFVGVIGADYDNDSSAHSRISNSEPATWNQAVKDRHVVAWEDAAAIRREPGRTSVVIPVARQIAAMTRWVDLVRLDASRGQQPLDLEIVLVGTAARSQYCILTAFGQKLPVKVLPRNVHDRLALLSNLGIAASTGTNIVLCRPNAHVGREDLLPLVAALADPAVAVAHPLVLRADMTIASAGGVYGPGSFQPHPLLAGFPVSDAVGLDGCDLPSALSPVLAMRAADLIALRGLEPLLGNSLCDTDLSLRAREAGFGAIRLVTDSRPTARAEKPFGFAQDMAQSTRVMAERWLRVPEGSSDLWARAGFDISYGPVELGGTTHRTEKTWGLRPIPSRERALRVREGIPQLRWTIDIAAPAGPRGEQWGDRHFAHALARSLGRLGQQVAVDHREARRRSTRRFDDVLLVLRGLDEVFPAPGPLNLLWVISHPDEVKPWEAARYHSVFAASHTWAERAGATWGMPITPLLQCTDPELFHPARGAVDSGPRMLFVGNSRKIFRPIVQHAVSVGSELAVYGQGWDQFLDSSLIAGKHVPNAEVGALYGSAGLVLNDHWDDMRREGFLSNRLFDAVACGARVVSDDVPGLAETFGDSVRIVSSAADLATLARTPFDEHFPEDEARVKRALQIHTDHSFDARAETLLAEVLRLRAHTEGIPLARRDPRSTVRRW